MLSSFWKLAPNQTSSQTLPFLRFIFLLFIVGVIFPSCRNDQGVPSFNQYPDDIGKLFFLTCSTAGCHNDASKGAASGLSMQSWEALMAGGKTSACVIPYRPEYSTIMYFINTYPDLGASLQPKMPYRKEAYTREEVVMVRDWILAGAPNRDGIVKFTDDDERKKFYVANQGCDVVTVFDQGSLLPIRYTDVGNSTATESPYDLKVSADGQYWYVVSILGNTLQKYRASDDSFVGEAKLGFNFWTKITLSKDGQKAYVSGWSLNGEIVEVNLTDYSVVHHTGLYYPSGSCLNSTGDTLYVTQEASRNTIYKIPVLNFSGKSEVNLFSTPPSGVLIPSEITFNKDFTKYFVTCQGTNEIRVFQQNNDSLLAIIPVGSAPVQMSISSLNNYLFVSCQDDTLSFPNSPLRGSVSIIDISSLTEIKRIQTGHQPRGIAADDAKGMVYVSNRNAVKGGPAPHHSFDISTCSGKNGYVTFIDMQTLNLVKNGESTFKVEVAVDPYVLAIRP